MAWSDTSSLSCTRADHDGCDGFNRVIDLDGHSTYVCECHCHTERSTCKNCGEVISRQKGRTMWGHGLSWRGVRTCKPTHAEPIDEDPR